MWGERALGIALGVVLGVAAVTAFVFLGGQSTIDAPELEGGGGHSPAAPAESGEVPVVRVVDGTPASSTVPQLEFTQGDRARFRVRSNTAIVVEVDRYGVSRSVPANGTATVSFPAKRAGEFAVIVAASRIAIARLIVTGS